MTKAKVPSSFRNRSEATFHAGMGMDLISYRLVIVALLVGIMVLLIMLSQ